jgi:hypothetical protein
MNEVEEAKKLVTPDIEEVRKAIELILEFEKVKNISIISRKGQIEFSKIYQKEEARSRVRKMVEETVKTEIEKHMMPLEDTIGDIERQIKPLDGKINQVLRLMTAEKIEEIEKPKEHPSDKKLDEVSKKHKN